MATARNSQHGSSDLWPKETRIQPDLDPAKNWKAFESGSWRVYMPSGSRQAGLISSFFSEAGQFLDSAALEKFLDGLANKWAFIAVSETQLVCAVDKIRSFPLFYTSDEKCVRVSNTGIRLASTDQGTCLNRQSMTEFEMAGYVLGRRTLFSGVSQILAGEFLVASSNRENAAVVHRYFRYLPKGTDRVRHPSVGGLVDQLDDLTKRIFLRMIEEADGREILVPLSGGLDSRLIVTMLKYLKYENIQTFSYGPRANYEAKIASQVAERLGVRWCFIPTTHRGYKDFYWSPARREYWTYCGDPSVVPNMQDAYPLFSCIQEKGWHESVVVNGQSGDFISGGHIPSNIEASSDLRAVSSAIIQRHFALRKSLYTKERIGQVSEQILDALSEFRNSGKGVVSSQALCEYWEWQERQCKYVVAGQRIYDWLGLRWELPLWDAEYLDFWVDVPVELKRGQALYRLFLDRFNFAGLFRNYNPTIWRWPGASIAVIGVARALQLVAGQRAKTGLYEYARYIGHYGPNFAPWGIQRFFAEASDIRNALPFAIDTWLKENGRPPGVPNDSLLFSES